MTFQGKSEEPNAPTTSTKAAGTGPAFDNEMQADPELEEGPASGGRIATFAIAIVVVLGAVFYGLNHGSSPTSDVPAASQSTSTQAPGATNTAQTPPAPAQSTAGDNTSPPNIRNNMGAVDQPPGTTTGAAPSRPEPPATAPTGAEVDRAKRTR